MIVNCEECEKGYRIYPDRIKGKRARAKCRVCGSMIIIQKPEPEVAPAMSAVSTPEPEFEWSMTDATLTDTEFERDGPLGPELWAAAVDSPPPPETKPKAKKRPKLRVWKPKRSGHQGMGLRTKMFLLFFVVPIFLVAAAGALYLRQLGELSFFLTSESSHLATQMAEERIIEKARSVAQEARLYLLSHDDLKKEDFNRDPQFKAISVQKVGATGYTSLFRMPEKNGDPRIWTHINTGVVGVKESDLARSLGKLFPAFQKIYAGVAGGNESKGYYAWIDKDGTVRNKFMACTPIEGLPYAIAATTYLDEFTNPIEVMEARAEKTATRTRIISLFIFVGTLLLIGLTVSIYGHRLTGRIKTLTKVADRISVGELDTEVDVDLKDELGDLAEAVTRMQDSIRLSIERLRRRR
ncbi:MAG: HAMP domain-containing protein [Deltaproteobacteria bacterium]|nr:HAMP domain-containing protein [Deltaproteobacteria bacterium]